MVSMRIEIWGSNIYQFLNVAENIIDWCVVIKNYMFDHILLLGKHLRFDFFVGIEEIIDN